MTIEEFFGACKENNSEISGKVEALRVKYEVEYLVWDKKSNPDWHVGELSFLKEVAVFGDLAIYRVSLEM